MPTPAGRSDDGEAPGSPDGSTPIEPHVGHMAPSTAFLPYRFHNGWAWLAVVLGVLASLLAIPTGVFGWFLPVALAVATVAAGILGWRRAKLSPWIGGRRAAVVAGALAALALVLVVIGLVR